MIRMFQIAGLVALAATALAAAPASAHDDCDRDGRSYYRSGRYYSRPSGYGRGYYSSGYGYGENRHDYEHDRLNAQHERWHETHPYASGYQHEREHERLAEKHDVFHHRNYGEHAPGRADRYYGDQRDYYVYRGW